MVNMPKGQKLQNNLSKPAFYASGKGMFDAKFHAVSWDVTFAP